MEYVAGNECSHCCYSGSEQEIIQRRWCWRLTCQVPKARRAHWDWGVWLCGTEQTYAALNSFFCTEHETANDYPMRESRPLESSHSVSVSKGGMVSISPGTRGKGLKKDSISLIFGFWVGFKPTFFFWPAQWSQNSLHESPGTLILFPRAEIHFFLSPFFSSISHHVNG